MTRLRDFGLELIGHVPWGTHACCLCGDVRDLFDILVPYLHAGLRANEYCLWHTSSPVLDTRATEAFRSAGVDLPGCVARGQMAIVDHDEFTREDGAFDAAHAVARLRTRLGRALSLGYEGMRVAGSTSWLGGVEGCELAAEPILALRTLDLDACKGRDVIDVLSREQYVLIRRAGSWALMPSRQAGEVLSERGTLAQRRAELLRKATHDLRTPLAAIAVAAQTARRRPECQIAASGLDRIIRSCARMDGMLTELSTAARLDLCSIHPDPRPVDSAHASTRLLFRLSESLDTRRVRVSIDEGLPPIQVDPSHLEQILEILIVTALRSSTDEEQVLLEATPSDPWVEFVVTRERQGATGRGFDRDGSALSLFVVQVLAEANGGTVSGDGPSEGDTGLRVRFLRSAPARPV